ncbi:MAG: FHA domain-containing protein [Solirubrobacteraceae bacterium]
MSTSSTCLRLEVISGIVPGNTIVVEDELVIGRHATGAGRLSEDEEISRQHARISREATGDYAIEDLGSSNGTFVNGLRIQSPRLLALGDSIEAGATTLVVKEIVRPQAVEAVSDTEDMPASELRSAPTVFARSPVAQPASAAPDSEDRPASDPRSAPTVFARSPAAQPVSAVPDTAAPRSPAAQPVSAAPDTAVPDTKDRPASEPRHAPTVFARSPAAQPGTAAPVPPTAPSPAPVEPASQTPLLALKLEVDFEAREARIALGDGGEMVSMVCEDGVWRVSPAGPDPDQ